jgi:hypothetical protein
VTGASQRAGGESPGTGSVASQGLPADAARNLFVVGLMIAVGSAIGFRFHAGPAAALAAVSLAVAAGIAFSWLNLLLGIVVRDAETAGLFPVIILTFSSSALVPVVTGSRDKVDHGGPASGEALGRPMSWDRSCAGHHAWPGRSVACVVSSAIAVSRARRWADPLPGPRRAGACHM